MVNGPKDFSRVNKMSGSSFRDRMTPFPRGHLLVVLYLCLTYTLASPTVMLHLADDSPLIGLKTFAKTGMPVLEFWGIPYAEPPIDSLRFRHPVPKSAWTAPLNCIKRPPACMQLRDLSYGKSFEGTNTWNPNTEVSEDCLFLNVWVPGTRVLEKSILPVLVWIYGGGFTSGSSALDVYDGRILSSEQNVIVVSMNYRLGIFGFFSLEAAEYRGNQGLLDQRLALIWVKNNIARFGGDPRNVTIFGESAGAGSVGLHTVSPLSAQLFKGAILESGSAVAPWATRSSQLVKDSTLAVAQSIGCYDPNHPVNIDEVIPCMQVADSTLLLKEAGAVTPPGFIQIPFGPSFDGYFITEEPANSLKAGKLNCDHLMLGANENEGNYFFLYYLPQYYDPKRIFTTDQILTTPESLNASISTVLPEFTKAHEISFTLVYHEYVDWSSNAFSAYSSQESLDKIAGDFFFTCPVVDHAKWSTVAGKHVYLYQFDHVSSVLPWPKWLGAMHGYEVMYVFGEPLNPEKGYSLDEKALSKLWMTYIGNFARTGDPNRSPDGSTLLQFWPKYNNVEKQMLVFSLTPHISSGLRTKQCYFWNEYLPNVLRAIGRRTEEDYDVCYDRAQRDLEHWANAFSCNDGAYPC